MWFNKESVKILKLYGLFEYKIQERVNIWWLTSKGDGPEQAAHASAFSVRKRCTEPTLQFVKLVSQQLPECFPINKRPSVVNFNIFFE
jgi:hypothetical protein